jgi:N-acetylglutamate synthase-like GNAT family acetyltransferase
MIINKIQISTALFSDLHAILELQKKCYISEAQLVNDYSIAPLTQDLNSIKKDFEQMTILKAELNQQIIASVRGYAENSTCFIGRLIVHPNYQNKGIGRKMMEAIEARFAKCNRYELFTGEKSLKNLSFYNKTGYTEFQRKQVSEKITLVFLEKHIL